MKTTMLVFVAFLAILTQHTRAAITGFLYETGPNGSYITQNQDGIVLPEDGWGFSIGFRAYQNREAIGFSMTKGSSEYWSIYLEMPDRGKLTPGTYVGNRFPFADPGVAGFDWSGNGRGDNTLTAIFQIIEVGYATDNITVNKLALEFNQFEETWNAAPDYDTQRWTYGSYRLNSDIPLGPVPEPATAVLLGSSVVGLGFIRRRRR